MSTVSPRLASESNDEPALAPGPPGFKERYSALTDFSAFTASVTQPPRKSLRVNTLKSSVAELRQLLEDQWRLEPVPWCPEGFFVQDPSGRQYHFGNLPGHSAGLFYIQEASSMIPAQLLRPQSGERVLDMCAAPGGKTTQMAQLMANSGRVWAADPHKQRLNMLRRNLRRLGVSNVTLLHAADFKFQGQLYDRILIDAPCSGTGTLRTWYWQAQAKEPDQRPQGPPIELEPQTHWYLDHLWGPGHFRHMGRIQRKLLHQAYRLLRKGGVMVYSTCSLEPEENEAVVDWFLQQHPKALMEHIDPASLPGLRSSPPVTEWEGLHYRPQVSRALRIMPQDNDTDGFFVARLRKPA